jgi:diketogulonate reductase-like aldo/keto reductase
MINIAYQSLKNGFSLSKLGFGTWLMGQRASYGPAADDLENIKAIRQAVDSGVLHIDTAELYGDGYVEEMIAKALVGVDRSKLFITSKVKGGNATKVGIQKAIEKSLKRLQTDYLDLYLIHYRDEGLDLEEGILALNDLVDRGLVKNIGVSNFAVPTLEKALSYSKRPIVVNQVQYSLQHREAEANGVLDFCQKNDIILEAWGPVRPINSQTMDIPIVNTICQKYNLTAFQLAISWLISQDNVTTLFKTSSLDHLAENLKAANTTLENKDVGLLRKEFPGQAFTAAFGMR